MAATGPESELETKRSGFEGLGLGGQWVPGSVLRQGM